MPRQIKIESKKKTSKLVEQKVNLKRSDDLTLADRLQDELKSNQSYLSLVLGLLIVLVVGILVFNYLKKTQPVVGPSQQTIAEQGTQPIDVAPQNLPGKYTVKEDDTLFNIAKFYYNDGYKFDTIAQANKLTNPDVLEVGQVLDIPVIQTGTVAAAAENSGTGTGGATNQTIWGEAITGNTYTVQEGDWLSKIAGRAYGDIMAFNKIAQANNISNPDVIEPGMVLTIPR